MTGISSFLKPLIVIESAYYALGVALYTLFSKYFSGPDLLFLTQAILSALLSLGLFFYTKKATPALLHWRWEPVVLACLATLIVAYGVKTEGLSVYFSAIWPKMQHTELFFLNVILLGPLFEELFYRGVLLERLCQSTSKGIAIFLSAMAWGFWGHAHLSVIGQCEICLLGAVLSFLRLQTGLLWPCWSAHVTLNVFQCAIAFQWF